MGMEKHGSKSFFQMFDWNSKSRKKLFSSKSDLPEKQSKQKKICERSHPTTQLHLLDEDRSSIKGSSDYSRASSVTDDDSCGTKAPNVVARLMGLDTLPTSNISDSYSSSSSPFLDSQSYRDARYNPKILECSQDSHRELASFKNFMVQNQKPINRPMEKFQTEVLPPKSAKSIPITHHKLLSPIKSGNFTPYRDAAYVMEAAARIIEPGPQAKGKGKLPPVGSSLSIPLRVKNLKEKVQSSARSSEECSIVIKNKGKSISLALQAKANVQKREGLDSGGHKEHNAFNSSQSSKTTPKITHKKPSKTRSGSSVLQPNNQKQNCVNCDRGKLQDGKVVGRESSSVRQRTSTKASGNSKSGIRQRTSSSDTRDDKREASCSSSERVVRKKRSVDGNYHQHDQKNQKTIKSNGLIDSQSRWDDDLKSNGSDVVSFTFTTPMRDSTRETREKCNDVSENYRSKRKLLSSDGVNKFSVMGNSASGGDALSTLLEQKFKELTCGLDFSDNKVQPISSCSSVFQDTLRSSKVGINTDGATGRGGSRFSLISEFGNRVENKMLLDYQLPSPVSVLDHSSVTESLNSLETAESSTRCVNLKDDGIDTNGVIGLGGSRFCLTNESSNLNSPDTAASSTLGIKQCSSNQVVQELLSKPKAWELEYVKEILCNIETMFKDYALGKTREIINPRLFDQLESRKWRFNGNGLEAKIARKALFDCVSECLDLKCKQYVSGGCKTLANGLSVVRRKDRLAEEVYNEISSWSCMGDSMVDEFVDKDMSGKYGRWVDFDVEAFESGKVIEDRILSSLLDEVVDDILGL